MTSVLITGANRGIGLALAKALVERGEFVFAGARRPGEARALAGLAGRHPDRLRVVALDVTRDDSVRGVVAAVEEAGGGLDVLVNNAGVLLEEIGSPIGGLDIGLFDATFAVNVTGAARVTQALLPALLRSRSPRIVNISSGAGSIGERPGHQYYCYGASKAALNHLTVGLASELREQGVVVVAMSPGWVRTDMGGADADLDADEVGAAIAETLPGLDGSSSGRFLDRYGGDDGYVW